MSFTKLITWIFKKDAPMDFTTVDERIAELQEKLEAAERRIPALKVVLSAEEREVREQEQLQVVYAERGHTGTTVDRQPLAGLSNQHISRPAVSTYVSADGRNIPEPGPIISRPAYDITTGRTIK